MSTPHTKPPAEDALLHVTLPASTAQVVIDALDLYSRLGLGQLGELASLARFGLLTDAKGEKPSFTAIEEAEQHLDYAKRALFGYAPNASHGIHSPKVAERFRTAWGVQKALRHRLAWDRHPEGGMQVTFDEPGDEARKAGVAVSSAAMDDILAELPPDTQLTRRGSNWCVTRLHATDRALVILGESSSPQTAIAQAKNALAAKPGRGLGF